MGLAEFLGEIISVKFVILLIVFGILPVWVFNIADINLLYKFGFTIAAALGIHLALQGKSMRQRR